MPGSQSDFSTVGRRNLEDPDSFKKIQSEFLIGLSASPILFPDFVSVDDASRIRLEVFFAEFKDLLQILSFFI